MKQVKENIKYVTNTILPRPQTPPPPIHVHTMKQVKENMGSNTKFPIYKYDIK